MPEEKSLVEWKNTGRVNNFSCPYYFNPTATQNRRSIPPKTNAQSAGVPIKKKLMTMTLKFVRPPEITS
jgi:hypothetical protein